MAKRDRSRPAFSLLTNEEATRLVAMLPKRKGDPLSASGYEQAREFIESVRAQLRAFIEEGINSWGTRRSREQDLNELQGLSDRVSEMLTNLGKLSSRVRLRLGQDLHRSGLRPAIPQIASSQPKDNHPLGTPNLEELAWLLIQAQEVAKREIQAISESFKTDPTRPGRPPSSLEREAVARLGSLWIYLGGNPSKISRFKTKDATWKEYWLFLDFVNAVGKTVNPKFNGRAACQDFVEANRKGRRLDPSVECQEIDSPPAATSDLTARPDSINEALARALGVCPENAQQLRSSGMSVLDLLAAAAEIASSPDDHDH